MSLKGDKYENQEEVRLRLENSVVLYDNSPVYITRCGFPEKEDGKKDVARVFFIPLPLAGKRPGGKARIVGYDEFDGPIFEKGPELKETRKFLSSRKFDLSPFKMGYFNHKGKAYYVSRAPVRQYKQGLTAKNCTIVDVKGKPVRDITFDLMLRTEGFVDMVNGKYPSFKQAGAMLGDEEQSSVAVSRTFAFVIDHELDSLFLLHKGIRCGMALKDDRAIRVPGKFQFLKEEMEDCRIPIA